MFHGQSPNTGARHSDNTSPVTFRIPAEPVKHFVERAEGLVDAEEVAESLLRLALSQFPHWCSPAVRARIMYAVYVDKFKRVPRNTRVSFARLKVNTISSAEAKQCWTMDGWKRAERSQDPQDAQERLDLQSFPFSSASSAWWTYLFSRPLIRVDWRVKMVFILGTKCARTCTMCPWRNRSHRRPGKINRLTFAIYR